MKHFSCVYYKHCFLILYRTSRWVDAINRERVVEIIVTPQVYSADGDDKTVDTDVYWARCPLECISKLGLYKRDAARTSRSTKTGRWWNRSRQARSGTEEFIVLRTRDKSVSLNTAAIKVQRPSSRKKRDATSLPRFDRPVAIITWFTYVHRYVAADNYC